MEASEEATTSVFEPKQQTPVKILSFHFRGFAIKIETLILGRALRSLPQGLGAELRWGLGARSALNVYTYTIRDDERFHISRFRKRRPANISQMISDFRRPCPAILRFAQSFFDDTLSDFVLCMAPGVFL